MVFDLTHHLHGLVMEKRRGSPLVTFSVLVAGLLLLLLGAEGLARWRWSEAQLLLVPSMPFLQDDPVLLWRLRPNLNLQVWPGEPLRTNRLGMRDEEVGPKKENIPRILSLGESTTWGHGVRAAETYTKLLPGLIKSPVEAINAGTPAWSVWQSAQYLEREGMALQPDVVLLYHLANDFLPRGASNPRDPFKVTLTDRQLSDARRPLAPLLSLLSASRLRQGLWSLWLAPAVAGKGTPGRDVVRVPEADRREALEQMLSLCQEKAILLVVIKPIYAKARYADDRLLDSFANRSDNLLFVDLPRQKTEQGLSDDGMFQPDDTHPTPAGHRWIAEQVATYLNGSLQTRVP